MGEDYDDDNAPTLGLKSFLLCIVLGWLIAYGLTKAHKAHQPKAAAGRTP